MDGTISLAECYQKTEQFVSRRIAGEAVLVPLRQKNGNYDHIYSLNETAACAWELLDGSRPLSAVVERLVAEFEVGEAQVVEDVLGLVRELADCGALKKV